MRDAGHIDAELKAAGIPVAGVSVGVQGDSSTVKIRFDAAATKEQQLQAEQVLKDFDWSAPEPKTMQAAQLDILYTLANGLKVNQWALDILNKEILNGQQ